MTKNGIHNKKTIALILTSIILFSGYASFLTQYLNTSSTSKTESKNGAKPSFLYLNNVTNADYIFDAKGEAFIIVEIEGIDFTWFALDGVIYDVSYGLNIFPIKFGESYESHQITIDPLNLEFFKSLTVEPLTIAEGMLETSLNQDTEINFKAGGMISILIRPSFLYNWLFIELRDNYDNSTLLKRIHDPTEYPEIDPLFYCLFMERGTFIRYDINVNPDIYKLILRGNGSLEYKIVVNSDWDQDYINDADEIQQNGFYDFALDPTVPDLWGFFEKSDENLIFSRIEENDYTEGYFSLFVPETYANKELIIRVNSGIFKEFIIDEDSKFFEGEIFNSNRYSPPDRKLYGKITAGWHHIRYKHKANFTSDIEFRISNEKVKVLKFAEYLDTDGDGIKDLEEINNGLDFKRIDTDEDGIPDNLDSSPLAKLELKPEKINQIVVPTDPNDDTIINLQIKKPINDYSTNGVPRLWRNSFNVSIYPVLRMFGNKYETETNTKEDMNRQKLIQLWGKNVQLLFESNVNFNEGGIGDPLPNPTDPNSEFFFILPNPSEKSIGYNIQIPKGHSSKNDGFLDMRFDFIWLVTKFDSDTSKTSFLHYYQFEENIIIQSMTKREVSNVDYLLGNPDNFIENQILWTLTQNPTLGNPEEFGIQDDIIGKGNVNYFDLTDRALQDRANQPLKSNETEVLYMAGLYTNYDVLNKIHLKSITNPDFATLHQGDYDAYFSSYAISNLYEEQNYLIGDSEIQGQSKILYQISYEDFSFNGINDVQKRANILGMPIAMEIDLNSKVLKITQAQGIHVPLNEIPNSINSQFSDKIMIWYLTYIERTSQNSGIPLINFEEGLDICKSSFRNRQYDVELSDLFFTPSPQMPAELLQELIDIFWDQISVINENFDSLADFVSKIQLPPERIDLTMIQGLKNKIDNFNMHSYSELSRYTQFFQFASQLFQDTLNLMSIYLDFSSEYNIPTDYMTIFYNLASTITGVADGFLQLSIGNLGESFKVTPTMAVKYVDMVNLIKECNKEVDVLNFNELNPGYSEFCAMQRTLRIRFAAAGTFAVIMGLVVVVFSTIEIINLFNSEGEYDDNQKEFNIRMSIAFCSLLLGVIITVEGILLLISALRPALMASLKMTITTLGIFVIVLTIVIVALDWTSYAIKWSDGDMNSFEYEFIELVSTTFLTALGISVAVYATGVGIIFAAMVVALQFITSWLSSGLNSPSWRLREEYTDFYFPSETKINIRKNGGLEIGDVICFKIDIFNSGNRPIWLISRFRTFGNLPYPNWASDWCGWKGRWGDSSTPTYFYDDFFKEGDNLGGYYKPIWEYHRERFHSDLIGATPKINYKLELQWDWESIEITWYPPFKQFHRETGGRYTDSDAFYGTIDIPVLEKKISQFYSYTTEYFSIDQELEKFYSARDEYRYKDAQDIVNEVRLFQEKKCKITVNFFNFLNQHLEPYDSNYSLFKTDTWDTVIYIMNNLYFSIEILPWADGYFRFLIPKDWVTKIQSEFSIVTQFQQLGNALPIKTNIKADLRANPIEMDAYSGIADVNLKLLLKGPDTQKLVKFIITAPKDFYITPQTQFIGPLSSTLHFNIIRNTTDFMIGVHYLNLKIYLGSILIYEDSLPFKIKSFSFIELKTYTAVEPIMPGEFFNAVDVINLGTYFEIINFTIEGIPSNFIYKELNPDEFIGDNQIFGLHPEESRSALIINPPRHYTTSPGLYTYYISANDHAYDSFHLTFSDTFIVDEFYDMDFRCINPEITIFDYQTGTYTFELTNLGNVPQEFQISFDDIPFADEYLSDNTINLAPGETQLITLAITPTGWGDQEFSINAISAHNSSTITGKITINDDDINPPEISNFEIIDTPIDVTVKFNIWNEIEGDDQGISNIKIFIDDELVLDYTPDSTETCFSFTFNDTFGNWFMENGTHKIRVEVIDNDFDVPNDSLNSSISGSFETELEDIYLYVDWQIEVLKNYTNTHLCWLLSKLLNNKLSMAQKHLEKAYALVEQGKITCGLIHDIVAMIMIEITEFRTEIFNEINFINDEDAAYIISSLHIIRNNIVLLFGTTSGTELGIPLASIEINLLNLNDYIEDEINWWNGKCLTCNIECATKSLEIAIFKASNDRDIECALSCAQWKLELTEKKVDYLLNKGEISQELADTIIFEIEQAQNNIETIKNSL